MGGCVVRDVGFVFRFPVVTDLVSNATVQHLKLLVEQTALHVWGPLGDTGEEGRREGGTQDRR